MRWCFSTCRGVALALAVLCFVPSSAHAQSFLQNLFSNIFGPSKPVQRSEQYAPLPSESHLPNTTPNYSPRPNSGRYRTVCVRLCDGYYFPINANARRGDFHRDAGSCSDRCGGGRLFYLDKNSDDIAGMVDLTGRRYDQISNAFLYRKTLIDGCSCRPMPWTAAERARHNRYRYQEELERINKERTRRLMEDAAEQKRILELADRTSPDNPQTETAAASTEALEDGSPAPPLADPLDQGQAEAGFPAGEAAVNEPVAAPPVTTSRKSERPRKRRTKKVSQPAGGGWLLGGGGSTKYRWPGDR